MNKDLFHVVRPMPVAGLIHVAGQLRLIPANTLQVISLRATGARHAAGAAYGEVVYEIKDAVPYPPRQIGRG